MALRRFGAAGSGLAFALPPAAAFTPALAGTVSAGAAYRAARRQAFDQAIALTQRYASLAVTTLAKVMADASAANAAKVSAATAMLKFGRESIELDDLAARIETLESEREDEGNQR